ncbi:MAG: aminomethyl-transferring glycine dehydrogenase [Prevotellaceae bacterium]|jgi:glycine dehydrogenase|nr:aminomethyl-transferring glycine dehydrogenase [Prevotellaceae bacterium]
MLEQFISRHNGPRHSEVKQMLETIGVSSIQELINQTIPESIRLTQPINLDAPLTEYQVYNKLYEIARKNKTYRSFIGMGYYGTAMPAVIQRNIFENPGWYTSYTPYQAEISQGRLEALINFQTAICSLTALPVANCSLLDEATAAAEAMIMMFNQRSRAAAKEGKNILFADENIFPQTLDVIKTRALPLGIEVEVGKYEDLTFDDKTFGVIVQYPAANGELRDYSNLCSVAHSKDILVCVCADILSLALLKAPGEFGADIAVGSTQRFGVPVGYGGPSAAYMATRDEYKRNMPGRIIGISIDRHGNKALRMSLQTREQHIKREKATSNICTSQALMATIAGMYAVYHGQQGIKQIASRIHHYAATFAAKLESMGYLLASKHFFDTIEILNADVDQIKKTALENKVNLYYTDKNTIRISMDELTTCAEIHTLLKIFDNGKSTNTNENCDCRNSETDNKFARRSEILQQDIFNKYHSETEMMRYIKKLERRDISLTHSMISLGSCTMKLNAAVEMLPLSFPEFASVHPFVPVEQAQGYAELIEELEKDLSAITGFAATSLQPNSGAAGEYAGLITIRNYQNHCGESHRNIALIPSSAHGTNPASAAMAGMKIIVVDCDEKGNINVDDLRKKTEENKENLSCIMLTYPSTHGVFESRISEIIDIVHSNGGQVYMDGANMNAQCGITNPGIIGADVCHLNLHKTFAMPHGGGGPGVGTISVAKHLVDFLPSHSQIKTGGKNGVAVAASPYGSAMLLPISYAYIKMLGAEGLKQVTEMAILNANYISAALKPHFKTLYTGENGRVGHECIIDLQHFKREYGIEAGDIARRLMDYGFHAPTLSFPVHETLMVEPTESESLAELDRFVEALIKIKQECEDIKNGKADAQDNVLKMAPHTAAELCANEWTHKYSREQAAFPAAWIKENKFFPYVSKIDNGYGDRNLVCTC